MNDLSNLPENYISWNDSVARVGGEEDFLIGSCGMNVR